MTLPNSRSWNLGHTLGVILFFVLGLGQKLSLEIPSLGWRNTVGLALLLFAWQLVAYAYRRGYADAVKSESSEST